MKESSESWLVQCLCFEAIRRGCLTSPFKKLVGDFFLARTTTRPSALPPLQMLHLSYVIPDTPDVRLDKYQSSSNLLRTWNAW
jgi:hypothetical protein